MNQWARTEKERSLLIMAPSILGQALQEFGLEREGIGDCNHFAGVNTGQNFADATVALSQRDGALFESLSRAHEYDLALADGLNGAGRHGERGGAFLDRDR